MKLTIWTGVMLAGALLATQSGAINSGRIEGHVVDVTTQAPIVGATVTIEGTGLSTQTGSDGRYSILNVPAGTYIVWASGVQPQAGGAYSLSVKTVGSALHNH